MLKLNREKWHLIPQGKWIFRTFSSASSHSLHVCIVGSGPAGFYTAEKMLKAHKGSQIDIIDRLPTPFGLVRSGVAPDHPETKIVVNQFSRVAANERCSFFGNVPLGSSVSVSELREIYHVVVLAYGAESDRVLGVPGEDLEGVYSAREFVWWYNGHPDCNDLAPDIKNTDTAIVLGQGNVALDVARILLRDVNELATTDIADRALIALRESSIRKVYLIGRRGPVQAACTAKELREILGCPAATTLLLWTVEVLKSSIFLLILKNIFFFLVNDKNIAKQIHFTAGIKDLYVHIKEADLAKSPIDEEELKKSRIQRRVYELFCKAATSQRSNPFSGQRELHFTFFRKPDRFLYSNDGNRVCGVRFEKTILKENGASGRQSSLGTGQFEDLNCGLVLKSIGYKSVPVDGLPFDNQKGVVPNIKGRVLSEKQDPSLHEKGLYVTGWLKRGPTGIIATNLYCAEETVESISEDLEKGLLTSSLDSTKAGREGLLQILQNKGVKFVSFSDWEKIDCTEKDEGKLRNRPRVKIPSWQELIKVAKD